MAIERVSSNLGSVHPHARGDNVDVPDDTGGAGGSPPRPWGQSYSPGSADRRCRFTPTPVGTMGRGLCRPAARSVHPHARGDNRFDQRLPVLVLGSPPRPWGQCNLLFETHCCVRFTPTPVGTIAVAHRAAACHSVHPHARGDNSFGGPSISGRFGSPPRPWGQYALDEAQPLVHRFTPTPVGTISVAPPRARCAPVHPHARGDNYAQRTGGINLLGSPPRPWGQF